MKFISRYIFLIVVITVFGLMFFSYVNSLYRQYQRNEYKDNLEKEISSLQSQKNTLEKMLQYVQTDEYKELKAKENLGRKTPGEKVIALPTYDSSISSEKNNEEIPLSKRPVSEQWLIYFFGKK